MLGLVACEHSHEPTLPKVLRIGVLPDESPELLNARYQVLVDYLQDELDTPCQLIIPDSYEHLVELFEQGRIDLAYFGGFTFVTVNRSVGAIPLVARKRDLDFSSYFLVRADHPAKNIDQLKGQSLIFGSRLSTSGHLMPRRFLIENEIDPESFFTSVRYSGAHDATAYHVRDGLADVGAANASVIDAMFDDGRLSKRDVRVLWETPPYLDYTWAVQSDLDLTTRHAIRDAYLKLSIDDPVYADVLRSLNVSHYLPVGVGAFQDLEQVAMAIGMIPGEPQ
jgi:phosphonate transport system substrate-binding protein